MISNKKASELAMIARNGASLSVDGEKHTASELAMVARNLQSGATLNVHNANGFTASEMGMVARNAASGATVHFS